MGIEYSIKKDNHLVHISVRGTINVTDLMDTINLYQQDDNFISGMNVLYDFSDGYVQINSSEMIALVNFLSHSKGQQSYKLAMVTPENGAYGLGRMFSVYAEDLPSNLRLFRDMQDSLQWLQNN